MQQFSYARPESVAEAVALLQQHGGKAVLLAGGTDLIIGLRERWSHPDVVVDLKRIAELKPAITERDGWIRFTASTVMADIVADEKVRRYFPALVEAADQVGSVQIRNRATMAGNICNGSPAADTAPPLLVYGAEVEIAGPEGIRRVPIDDFIIGPGKVDLGPAELVTAIEIPIPPGPYGAAYQRMTRRRGTDLASITLCCGVGPDGVTRLSYGSVGPRAWLIVDESGVLADPAAPEDERNALLASVFADASPSPTSMRAGPEYRVAMLPVLGARALQIAIERLAEGTKS
jgi:carbon-monoxide dehydrogenase medium subunit